MEIRNKMAMQYLAWNLWLSFARCYWYRCMLVLVTIC